MSAPAATTVFTRKVSRPATRRCPGWFLLVSFQLLVWNGWAAETLPPGAAASVNGTLIPQRLVDTFLTNSREALGLNLDPATDAGRTNAEKARRAILDELVNRTLIAQGAAARGAAPTAAQLDAAEQDMIAFCGSLPSYEAYVAQNGFDRTGYRENILATNANGKALRDALAKELPAPADAEVKAYFDAHVDDAEFQWPERVTALHIYVNALPGVLASQLKLDRPLGDGPELDKALATETERRRLLAEELRAKAATPGADFEALARQHSEDFGTRPTGGMLGTFGRGAHSAAMDEALFTLPVGAVGPAVVKDEYGFHVVKVLDHRPAGRRTVEEAAPIIRRRLTEAALARRLREWLQEARAKAVITPALG